MSSKRNHRTSYQGDDLNLSLTGSQISTMSHQRPQSAKLKRPSSMTDLHHKSKQDGTPTHRKTRGTPSATPRSDRSSASTQRDDHPPRHDSTYRVPNVQPSVRYTPRSNGNDDFLALFENTTKPKIHTSANDKRNAKSPKTYCWSLENNTPLTNKMTTPKSTHKITEAGDSRQQPHNQSRHNTSMTRSHDTSDGHPDNQWMSLDQIGRSLNTASGVRKPAAERPSITADPSDHPDRDWTSLDQISRVLHEANDILSSTEDIPDAIAAYPITNNLSVLGKSPRPRASVSSIENIKHKTPVNEVKQGWVGQDGVRERLGMDMVTSVQGAVKHNGNDHNTNLANTKDVQNLGVSRDAISKHTVGNTADRLQRNITSTTDKTKHNIGNASDISKHNIGSTSDRSKHNIGSTSDRSAKLKTNLSEKSKTQLNKNSPRTIKQTSESILSNTNQSVSRNSRLSNSILATSYQPTPLQSVNVTDTNGYKEAEEYIEKVNRAATTIQRWYLRHITRRKMAGAALKRMLDQKKRDLEEGAMRASVKEDRVADRKKLREEKAQSARRQAIQDLQQKREDKRDEVKRKAEEQLSQLEAEGKIGRSLNKGVRKPMTPQGPSPRVTSSNITTPRGVASRGPTPRSPTTNGVTPRVPTTNGVTPRSPRVPTTNELTSVAQLSPAAATKSPPPDVNIFFEETSRGPAGGGTSEAHTKTTLNDLLDTLKLLEQEEKIAPTPRPLGNCNGWNIPDTPKDDQDYLTAERLQKLNERRSLLDRPGILTDDKLRSIHSFLDEVETADRVSHIDSDLSKPPEDLQYPPLLVPSIDELTSMEQAAATANQVTSTVLTQKMELDEKKRTVKLLQKALNQQRELTVRHARESDKEMKKRLDVQKDEYEEAVTRHLSFIDQLIDDKKSLTEKCDQLVKELKQTDNKYQDKIRTMDDSHTVEMKKLEEMHKAAEKLRREKWADDMTKKIKERTVKGLEPEIQRLIAKQKTEMKKVKQIQEAELLEADERAAQRYVKMTEELRDQLALEKEAACTRERDLAKQRYEKQMQQEEESYQQQRRRLHTEVHDEKERLAQQAARQRLELDKLQRQLEDSHGTALDAMKGEFEKARVEQDNRHAIELREIKERLVVEREAWEENYRKKQDVWLTTKERELKETLRKERDQQIELVITQLEEDSTVSRQDCERTADNKIRRIRDKYESEIRELEMSEKQAIDKYNKMKGQVADVEGENERLKVIVKQKDEEVADVKKMSEKLHNERDRVSDVVRQEYADRIVATEEENKHVKSEMHELRSRHKVEIEKLKTDMEVMQRHKDDEMEDVHKRVKQAISKKDDVVAQLKQQYQAAVKRADHLEGLLDQQRKLISK